jgi:hypothetical protein
MTSDRKAKKTARARMAATGERYTTARREVAPGAGALPHPMTDPPDIDPGEYAIRTVSWGALSYQLVQYQGHYYVWHCWRGKAEVYQMPSAAAGHAYLDDWHAFSLLTTPWDQRAAHVYPRPDTASPQTGYEAAVIILAQDGGTWFASRDRTAGAPAATTLVRFEDVSAALAAFADHVSQAAARAERAGDLAMAAALTESAAAARNQAGQASFHDLPVTSAPGARLPESQVRTHATYTVDGSQYALVSYRDTAGEPCVAVDVDGNWGSSLTAVQVNDQKLLGAGLTMATRGHGIAVIYGRAHDSVTAVYAVMMDGERVDWPVHGDPGTGERYFAVIADCQVIADIVATAPAAEESLKRFFPSWFSKDDSHSPRRPAARC